MHKRNGLEHQPGARVLYSRPCLRVTRHGLDYKTVAPGGGVGRDGSRL